MEKWSNGVVHLLYEWFEDGFWLCVCCGILSSFCQNSEWWVCVAIDPRDVLMGSGIGCKWSYKGHSGCLLTVRIIWGWCFLFLLFCIWKLGWVYVVGFMLGMVYWQWSDTEECENRGEFATNCNSKDARETGGSSQWPNPAPHNHATWWLASPSSRRWWPCICCSSQVINYQTIHS